MAKELLPGPRPVSGLLTGPETQLVLDAALGTALDEDEVGELRTIIDASGAHEQVERVIDELVSVALTRLDSSSAAEPARQVLRELALAATDRTV